ncbi:MAG TPA: NADPH-dependent FMN reductase [Ktedonobacterales bacterium]
MHEPPPEPLRVLGIAGSLRRGSLNRGLLRAAIELAPDHMVITPYEGLRAIPPYDGDVEAEGDPDPVADLKARIRGADALLIVSPEYNYGIPGVLKNAIDWVSRPPRTSPLSHKPIAIMGASTGNFGTARCQLALRQTFHFTKSYVLIEPDVLVVRAAERFDDEGNLRDEATREHVARLVESLERWVRGLRAGAIIPD